MWLVYHDCDRNSTPKMALENVTEYFLIPFLFSFRACILNNQTCHCLVAFEISLQQLKLIERSIALENLIANNSYL